MRPSPLLIACVLLLAGSHAGAEPLPEFDHHDPAALNAAAARLIKVGAGGTALILLERARVIYPDNALIASNLSALQAYLANPGTISLAAPTGHDTHEPAPVLSSPPLPAPWPLR